MISVMNHEHLGWRGLHCCGVAWHEWHVMKTSSLRLAVNGRFVTENFDKSVLCCDLLVLAERLSLSLTKMINN